MPDARRVAIAAVLIALAAGSWWLAKRSGEPERIAVFPAGAPDYVIEHFTTQAYDPAGRPRYRLSAERLTHYPHDDHADLVKPYIIQYFPGRAAVHTRADAGQLTDNETRLFLQGNVHSSRGRDPRGAPADIIADTMRIELDQPEREGAARGLP